MASILDTGLASVFTGIIVFLLIFTVVYGVLKWKKWMGDQEGIYAIIALSIAFMMSVAAPARNFVTFIAPWFIALAMVGFFMLFIVSLFGVGSDKFPDIVKDSRVRNWIVIISILIVVTGLGITLGPSLAPGNGGTVEPGTTVGPPAGQPGSTATADFGTNLVNTLFHPKVLGLLVTFFIAALAVYFLSEQSK